jgi:hypothetical protein
MSRRKSSVCLLLSQLDDRIKDKILNMTVDKEKLKKFDEIEKKEILSELFDLRDLTDKSENEILKTLNFMTKNKQYILLLIY